MTLSTIVLLVLALYALQIVLQETTRYRFNLWMIMGNRDHAPKMSLLAGRLDRAKTNLQEALPVFLALVMLNLFKTGDAPGVVHGALIFLVARVIYVPAYLSGLPVLRSLVLLVANAGLVMMALPLI